MTDLKLASKAKIIDITKMSEYENHLYRCLAGPFRRYKKKNRILEKSYPKRIPQETVNF